MAESNNEGRVRNIIHLSKRFFKLTKEDDKSIVERGLKATEEMGELAQAILSNSKIKGCSYKKLSNNEVIEESIDVLMVVTSILLQSLNEQSNIDFVLDILKKKIDKWESVVKGV